MRIVQGETSKDPSISDFEAAVNELDKLETMPAVAQRILAITADPDCDVEEVGKLVATDPALSMRLMKVANSVQFRRPVSNLRAALIRLGLRDVRSMAVTATLLSNKQPTPFHDALWSYSLKSATMAEAMSRMMRNRDISDPFLCGLLHDFGTLVLANIRGESYRTIVGEPGHEGQRDRELQEYGFDHCDIGAMVAQKWNLVDDYEYVMQFHHCPLEVEILEPPAAVARAVYLVSLARRVAVAEFDPEPRSELDGNLRALIGLTENDMAAAAETAHKAYDDLAAALL